MKSAGNPSDYFTSGITLQQRSVSSNENEKQSDNSFEFIFERGPRKDFSPFGKKTKLGTWFMVKPKQISDQLKPRGGRLQQLFVSGNMFRKGVPL